MSFSSPPHVTIGIDVTKAKRILTKTLKVFGWIFGSIILVLLLVIAAIQIPSVQNKITQKAIAFLEEKIGTEVRLESLYISFPKNIVLTGLYLEDQKKDTLLYAGKLTVNTDLWALTRNEIQLNKVRLENTTAFIKRADGDSAFNYSYIVKAFAGDSTAVPDTLEQKGWNFDLESLALENINAHYHDRLTGNFADLKLGNFELDMDEFDLNNLVFGVEDITLENTMIKVQQTKLPEVTEEVAEETYDSTTFDLNFNEIELRNVVATYAQQVTGQNIRLDVGETVVKADQIDLKNRVIDLDQFELKNTLVSYQQHPSEKLPKQAASSATQSSRIPKSRKPAHGKKDTAWKISLNDLELADNSIQYYDYTKKLERNGVDFDHLWFTNLSANAKDIRLQGSAIQVNLQNFVFQERSGLSVKTFQGKIKVSEDSASLENFLLETANSRLAMKAQAGYESLENIGEHYPEANLKARINPSFVGIQDLLLLAPTILDSIPLNLSPRTKIQFDAFVDGKVNRLSIHHFVLKAFSDTYLKTSGSVVGLPDMKKLHMNIALEKFYTTKQDVLTLLPDTLLPDSIAPPAWVNVNGQFKGNVKKAEFKTLVATNIGSVDAKGNMNLDSASATRGFAGNVNVNEFDLGELLMQPKTIGKLDLQASINSQGLTRKEMNSALEAKVNSFTYKDHDYKDFNLKAKVQNDVLNGWAALNDSSLAFTLKGDYNFQEEVPKYNFTFDLKNADLKSLNLSLRPLKFRGTLDVNMATADFKILNGQLGLRKVAIYNGDDLYAVDSLLFVSIDQEGRSEINIDSDIMKGSFQGSINIFEMPATVREYFNTYYSLHDSVEQSYESPQHFTFDLKLKKTELITEILLPELSAFEPGEIKGEFDSKRKQLQLRFDIPVAQYSNIGVRSFLFSTNSDSSRLNYNLLVDKIMIDSMKIDGLEFNGTVSHDSIRTNLIILDSANVYKYMFGGTFFSREKEFELVLNPNEVKLLYQNWKISPNNYIRFGGEKLVAQNVNLSNGNERIILESKPEAGSPIFVGFRELNLEYLSSMFAQENPLSGLLHGDINLYPDPKNSRFTANVGIRDFRLQEIPWGNVSLEVQQQVQNRFDVNFSVVGKNNDIRAVGNYTSGEVADLNIKTTIARFDLKSVQPIVQTQLKNLTGNLTGEISVKGPPSKLDIDGGVNFRKTKFLSTFLNSSFTLDDERISFIDEGLSFDNFEMIDADKNKATLDGVVATKDYRLFNFRLNLLTQNFRLLNTTKNDNELFYGKVNVNANARIRGTSDNPSVNMEMSLSEGSNLTYVVPQSEASILETQGIVKFVDKTFKDDPFMKRVQQELADSVKSTFKGVDLTAKIELTDKEKFTIIIDPTTNDQLTVAGNTTLTLQMDATGDMQLSGRYEISEGTYNLSFYKFLKREFNIEKGSTMTWSGDPLNAEMDIRAIFEVETSAIDLLSNQLVGSDPQIVNRYKQRLPFLVYLNIKGELLTPEISFRLDMPIDERDALEGNVYAKLMDINTRESDLNKQVFALLILKRFVSDNPLESQAGGGFEGTARTSVSKILTEQLNRLSENVRGVELSFDVKSYEDYSTGQAEGQTELQLGVSKTLLNDRLVVKIAGNVDIEGQNSKHDVTDYIGDLALEYLLTDDGRFRITGFRNSNYDMIDGELTETGAGLIFIKDYDSLRELFKANEKKD